MERINGSYSLERRSDVESLTRTYLPDSEKWWSCPNDHPPARAFSSKKYGKDTVRRSDRSKGSIISTVVERHQSIAMLVKHAN
ncbi:MAG: hypothetical protein CV089_02950 [Nitrospira sp. WS110]|nr:hypothetical protein [Nitrospira sp. WS110]